MATALKRIAALSALCVILFLQDAVGGVDQDHAKFTAVLSASVVDGRVDYDRIAADERFEQYLDDLRMTVPSAIGGRQSELAFWINAYNPFTIKLIIDRKPKQSIREIRDGDHGPWDISWISINGLRYSLNQIEHEIIRPYDEPRIHMALVCAAISCPPLRSEAYTGSKLEEQLDDNAREFLLDPERNRFDASAGTLFLSSLFEWYGEDFKARYGSAARYVLQVMGLAGVETDTVRYLPYDWNLNSR